MSSGQTTTDGVAAAVSLTVEDLPIADLRPDPGNPRRIEETALAALTRSIATFGVVDPVLARRADPRLIAGHQRLVAARRAGLTTVARDPARPPGGGRPAAQRRPEPDRRAMGPGPAGPPPDRPARDGGPRPHAERLLRGRSPGSADPLRPAGEKRARPERFALDEALAAVDREASGIPPASSRATPRPRRRWRGAWAARPRTWSSPIPPTT